MEITIVEVGPRDGLQNDPLVLSLEVRGELVRRLVACGLQRIEVGSFVSPKVMPTMAGTGELVGMLVSHDHAGASYGGYTALVPNLRGYLQATKCGLQHVRLIVLASGEMNRRNLRCDPQQTMAQHEQIALQARSDGLAFGGVIGTAFGCPYQGAVALDVVLAMARQFVAWGADEVVLGDTTGMATPRQVREVSREVAAVLDGVALGGHFHNTRNSGYANALAALEWGATILDASVGGIGGCPFAPRAVGNIATDDLVHLLNGMGVATGVDLDGLLATNLWLAAQLGRPLPGMVERAGAVFGKVVDH